MSELPELIDHQGIGQMLNDMHWFVVTAEADAPRLLTSDRPLFLSAKLGAPDCYLTLPIAPDRLFVAVNSKDSEAGFRARPQKELIEETNVRSAQQAAKYVYGGDNVRLEFVDRYISTARQPSFFRGLTKFTKTEARFPNDGARIAADRCQRRPPPLRLETQAAALHDRRPAARKARHREGGPVWGLASRFATARSTDVRGRRGLIPPRGRTCCG